MNNVIQLKEQGREEEKIRFIGLRAKGLPYSKIAGELKVSKGTLTVWDKELKEEIGQLKRERLEELYDSYFMLKESRIKRLGDTLNDINTALETKDLTELTADKLLDYKIKYMKELKEEIVDLPDEDSIGTKLNADHILNEFIKLFVRVRQGEISKEQADREQQMLENILKTYKTCELEEKIEALQSVIMGRGGR